MIKKEKCGRINPNALAMSLGVIWGVYVFLLGIILTFLPNIKFFWISSEFLVLISTLYPGYSTTIIGSFVGLFWGVLCGIIGGFIIAWLHNYSLYKYCN